MLADGVTVWSDGGGRATAARKPVRGKERVARFFVGLAAKAAPGLVVRTARVNGAPGVVGYAEGRPAMVLSLDVEDGLIRQTRPRIAHRRAAAGSGRTCAVAFSRES